MTKAVAVTLAVLFALVAGCGGSSSGSKTEKDGSTVSKGDTQGGMCKGYQVGKGGVVRLFCDGKATADVTVAGKTHHLEGGACEDSDQGFAVNFGVAGTDTKAPYFGVVRMPDGTTTFMANLEGKAEMVMDSTVEVSSDKATVSASGKTMSGQEATAKVNCNG